MIDFPKPVSLSTRLAIEATLDGYWRGVSTLRRPHFFRLVTEGLVAPGNDQVGPTITTAGYNAVGRPAVGQAWGEWTVAWRMPRENRFVRAINWAGTWTQAREMAAAVRELLPPLAEVYYTSTLQAELDGRVHAEDRGNILVDSGRRVRIIDSGMLPAELLDREVETVVFALVAAEGPDRMAGWTITSVRERVLAARKRMSADEWAAMVGQGAHAGIRFNDSHLAQTWVAQEEPARAETSRVAKAARAEALHAALARAEAEPAELEGWGQPEGMLADPETGEEQDRQRPDACKGCTYLPGPDYGTRVSSSPTCPVHTPPARAALSGYDGDPRPR